MSGGVKLNLAPQLDNVESDVENILTMVINKAFNEEDDWNVIIEACNSLAAKWELISGYLGLSPSLIDKIRGNHPSDNTSCLNDALLQWIKQNYNVVKFGEPSWKTLLHAIAKVDKLYFKKLAADHQVSHMKEDSKKDIKILKEIRLEPTSAVSSSQGETERATFDLKSEVRKELCAIKSQDMLYSFQKLFHATRNSLSERNISVTDLVHHIECLGCLKPTYNDLSLPPLRHQLRGLAKAETVDTVMSVVKDYCSFFNYRMLEHIIEEFGTEEDQTNLAKYKEEFKVYAECCVFECPIDLGAMCEEGHANMFVTLDDSFEGCTLSHINAFIGNLRKILNLSSDVALKLCRISPGSLKLIFQMLQLFQHAIFPLSNDQEAALAGLGVVYLSCGGYQFATHKTSTEINDVDTYGGSPSGSEASIDTYYSESISMVTKLPACNWKKRALSVSDSGIGKSSILSVTTAGRTRLDLFDSEFDVLGISDCVGQDAADSPNICELFKAAQKGELEEIKQLIEDRPMNALLEDNYGQNILHLAARGGHIDVMKYLSEERGHNPASQSLTGRRAGWTPLHHAAACNQLEMIQYLVDKQQVDPLCQTKDGSTPLHLACFGGNVKVVAYLVKEMRKYLPLKDIINFKNDDGAAPVHTAALCGHLETVKYLTTDLNCDPNAILTGDCTSRSAKYGGRTALHHAAQRGHLDTVKFLVEQKNCNPSHMDDNKVTPLHIAAQGGHLATVQYLSIEQHCDASCTNISDDTPLHHAARCGHLEIVKFLVETLQCQPNIKGQRNKTPLEQARIRDHKHVVKYLAAKF